VSPYVRTMVTASGARAVQIVHSSRRGSRALSTSVGPRRRGAGVAQGGRPAAAAGRPGLAPAGLPRAAGWRRRLTAELGCLPSAVYKALEAAGIPRGGRPSAHRFARLGDRAWLRRRYDDALSLRELASEIGCRVTAVCKALAEKPGVLPSPPLV
jgi:hypothetical protein